MIRTDEDAAMQAQPVSAQWLKVQELQAKGWHYQGRDACGRRIHMRHDNNDRCVVDDAGRVRFS